MAILTVASAQVSEAPSPSPDAGAGFSADVSTAAVGAFHARFFFIFGKYCYLIQKYFWLDFTLKVIGGDISTIPGLSDAIKMAMPVVQLSSFLVVLLFIPLCQLLLQFIMNSGFTSAASPSVVLRIIIGSPLLHLRRHPSAASPIFCHPDFYYLPSNLLSFNPH
ncbi:hypothetical protein PVK06_001819 [Gossypium arboreum]|uniref:Uncharacterized protein n=1 Tax=Gossypium arboreum TaxID=29729 RepID=A0ABR0R277_GOSAR|nr:hypothetical protein PVK06_001819 [Gossypium arboreum]